MQPHHIGHLAIWIHPPKLTSNPKLRILLVHGLGEHSARHTTTINYLTHKLPIEVIRFDLRGAGKSGGNRQWIESFQDYIEDTHEALLYTQKLSPQLPIILMGHSLGGAISISYAAKFQNLLTALILSAPAVNVGSGISPTTIYVGKLASKIFPKFQLKSKATHWISRNPHEVQKYLNDSLSSHFTPLQQGKLIIEQLQKLLILAETIKIPTIIFQGTHDTIVSPEGAFELLKALKSPDKELCYLPMRYHEPHNDYDAEDYLQRVVTWISRFV